MHLPERDGRRAAPPGLSYHFDMKRAGFVLAGGSSSRMGRDKALLRYGSATLIQHVAERVATAVGSATLVGSPARYARLGYPVVPDNFLDGGPLAGIQAALAASAADWNLVVACDMPGVTVEFLEGLLAVGLKRRSCLLLIVLLTVFFMIIMMVTMARGLKIDCGCGLFFQKQVGPAAILEDAVFLVWAVGLYWWELAREGRSRDEPVPAASGS